MPDILKRFGRRIAEYRRKKGLSQEAFAKVAGFHRTYISQVEIGRKNTTFTNIVKLAKALGCRPGDLFDIQPREYKYENSN